MSDLEEIKRKRLEELQNSLIQQQNQELQEQINLQRQIEVLENIAKQYLNKEAISRYGNLKSAHPELAIQVAVLIAQAAQSGQIKDKLNDKEFKEILMRIQKPKQEFKVKRK